MNTILYLAIGLVGGILSGLLGLGGGVIIIPALVLLTGMSQHLAQGTTLAMMVPPIGLLAAWVYYHNKNVDIKVAIIMCISFVIGTLLSAPVANKIPQAALTRIFGVALLLISLKMIFFTKS